MDGMRLTTAFEVGQRTIRVVEAVSLTRQSGQVVGRIAASLRPVAVVISDGESTVAVGMNGDAVDVSSLDVSLDDAAPR